jgi:ferredoxin--NADP+ reductase
MTTANERTHSLRVAIIGSGPSGLYAAEALTRQKDVPVSIDVFDRLPTPYGLVRYGVAPDHQKIKDVTKVLQRILEDSSVRFLGNVVCGRDITHSDLRRFYDAVIYAVGASTDRALDIPGEHLAGSLSATKFVSWYNSHPDWSAYSMEVNAKGVAVIGVGNVAVDVARVLAKTYDELKATDIAPYALDVLKESPVTDIYLLGRRGPAQAKFTTKELKDLGLLEAADVVVRPDEVELSPSEREAVTDATVLRNIEVLREFARGPLTGKPRRIHLRFLVSPIEILGEGSVEGLRIERNRLDGRTRAIGTGAYETLPVQMVLRAVGYKGEPLAGVPFDHRLGVIPNDGSHVLRHGEIVPGEYVTGWIKSGPVGVIGTNKPFSAVTARQLLRDAPTLPKAPMPDPEAVTALLDKHNVAYVTMDQWLALDRHELETGLAQGRARAKVHNLGSMLDLSRREPVTT